MNVLIYFSIRNMVNQQIISLETPLERSTLQVLLSDRIIITGILNEILMVRKKENLYEIFNKLQNYTFISRYMSNYYKQYLTIQTD